MTLGSYFCCVLLFTQRIGVIVMAASEVEIINPSFPSTHNEAAASSHSSSRGVRGIDAKDIFSPPSSYDDDEEEEGTLSFGRPVTVRYHSTVHVDKTLVSSHLASLLLTSTVEGEEGEEDRSRSMPYRAHLLQRAHISAHHNHRLFRGFFVKGVPIQLLRPLVKLFPDHIASVSLSTRFSLTGAFTPNWVHIQYESTQRLLFLLKEVL